MFSIKEEHYKYLWAIGFVVLAVLCYTLIYSSFLNWSFVRYAITYLDKKANTILAITGASTSASVAVTLLPGDLGTPVANKLADISSYSIVILSVIHLEKYLITIAAEIALKLFIPVSLGIEALNILFKDNNDLLKKIVKKICVFSMALVLAVPASVRISTLIEKTYHDDVQISLEEIEKEAAEIKESYVDQD